MLTLDGASDSEIDGTVEKANKTPVATSKNLRATLSMFRKNKKRVSAPSAASKAASSIEEKWKLEKNFIINREEREQTEHLLKVKLLNAQISLFENLNRALENDPKSVNVMLPK